MDDLIASINLNDVRQDSFRGIIQCNKRGMVHSAKWLAEVVYGLEHTEEIDHTKTQLDLNDGIAPNELDKYYLAKSYFDCREYDRSAFFSENCESPIPKFLHYYAQYMAAEKRRQENLTDSTNFSQSGNHKNLNELMTTLKYLYTQRNMDAYMLYLLGVVLKKCDLNDLAIPILIESIHAEPTLWSSWIELASLITHNVALNEMNLPNHWMKALFTARTLIQLSLTDEGTKIFEDLQAAGFKNCLFITSQMAIAYHNKRLVDKAISVFQHLQEIDPYRLDNIDLFSNLLFVKEYKKEMAFLAHKAVEIDKYRPETCCVIGNYYSIRGDHQKAISYFQRALKLNPNYISAWTLMGHEFMEMKNTNAAIQSYRKGVEVNRRDYRAWYGLGQSYEILKMPYYSLYYYKIAQQIRPTDSRMLVALGETYERLDRDDNALKCYEKACNVGDIEGIALLRLADLYYKIGAMEAAVPAYLSFCSDEQSTVDRAALCRAFVTLGNYYEGVGNLDEASYFAYKCLEYDDTKAEARSLLKSIENARTLLKASEQDNKVSVDMTIDETVEMDQTSNSDIIQTDSPSGLDL